MANDACSAPIPGAQEKACNKCGVVKPLQSFAKSSQTKSGVRAACKECCNAVELSRRIANGAIPVGTLVPCSDCGKEYPKRNGPNARCLDCAAVAEAESHRAANAAYEARRTEPRRRDPEERRAANRRYAERHPERVLERSRRYNDENREEINRKARDRNKTPERKSYMLEWDRTYRAKPKNRIDQRMKTAIGVALKGAKRGRKWESLVGYTVDELYHHLEKQFLPGMTWDNIGDWHIDHILPRCTFSYDTEDDPEFKACWALTNLRPMWAVDNLSKGGKRLFLI